MPKLSDRLRAAAKAFYGRGEQGTIFKLGSHEDGFQRGLELLGNDEKVAAVHACIAAYAQSCAAMPLRHTRTQDNGGTEIVRNSVPARLFRRPNGYQSGSDFRLNLVYQLMLRGNGYAVALRNARGEVESLHPIPSLGTVPHIEPQSQTIFYGIGYNPLVGDMEMLVPQRDVLHIRLETPNHPLVGVSPLEYAADAIARSTAISTGSSNFFANMSRPSGVISTDEKLSAEQVEELRRRWNEKTTGLNAGDVAILTWGMKWQPMTMTADDSKMVESYQATIEDISRVFRIPLPLINRYENATFNNVEALISAWLATGLGFVMEHVEAALNVFFGLPPEDSASFDESVLLRSEFASRIDGLTKGIMGGLYSPNEARNKEGLPSVEGGEEPRVQQQVVPLSWEPEQPAPAPQPEPQPSESEESETDAQVRGLRFVGVVKDPATAGLLDGDVYAQDGSSFVWWNGKGNLLAQRGPRGKPGKDAKPAAAEEGTE